jgi:hypothetical protein
MATAALTTADNLFDFFHAQVDVAVDATGARVSEESVYYLSALLAENGHTPPSSGPQTLVDLRLKAASAPGPKAIPAWRELGDRALYTAGFFEGSLKRGLVSLDYYVSMGASAYDRLARLLASRAADGRGLDAVFAELAGAFEDCARVLREVRAQVQAQSEAPSDAVILRLYEEWQTTRSPAAAARLRALGVLPAPGPAAEG